MLYNNRFPSTALDNVSTAQLKGLQSNLLSVDSTGKFASLIGSDAINLIDLSDNKMCESVKFASKSKRLDAKWSYFNAYELAVTNMNYVDIYRLRSDNSTFQAIKQFSFKSSVRPIKKIEWSRFDSNIFAISTSEKFKALAIWDVRGPNKPSITLDSISTIKDFCWNNYLDNELATMQENDVVVRDIRNLKSSLSISSNSVRYRTIHPSFTDPYSFILGSKQNSDYLVMNNDYNKLEKYGQDLIQINYQESLGEFNGSFQSHQVHLDRAYSMISIIPFTDIMIILPLPENDNPFPGFQLFSIKTMEKISKFVFIQESDLMLTQNFLPDTFDSQLISFDWKIEPVDERTFKISLVVWSDDCYLTQYPITQICSDAVYENFPKNSPNIESALYRHFDFRLSNSMDTSRSGNIFSCDQSKPDLLLSGETRRSKNQEILNRSCATDQTVIIEQDCIEFDTDILDSSTENIIGREIAGVVEKLQAKVEVYDKVLRMVRLKVFFFKVQLPNLSVHRKSFDEDMRKNPIFHSDSNIHDRDVGGVKNLDHWIRLEVKFPIEYPGVGAIPSYQTIEASFHQTPEIAQKILQTLNSKSADLCKNSKQCLEVALIELISLLERTRVNQNDRDIKSKMSSSLQKRNLTRNCENFPIIKYSGVHFTTTGHLVAFNIDENSLNESRKIDTSSELKFGRDKDQRGKQKKTSQLILQYLSNSGLCTDLKLKYGASRLSKDYPAYINNQSMAIYDFSYMTFLEKSLGINYDLNVENLVKMCQNNYNLVVNLSTRIDLCQFWDFCVTLAKSASFVNVSLPRQLPPIAKLPFGKEFLEIWQNHFLSICDIQSLALLSLIVLSLDRIQFPKISVLDRKALDFQFDNRHLNRFRHKTHSVQGSFVKSKKIIFEEMDIFQKKSCRKNPTNKESMNISVDLNTEINYPMKEEDSDGKSRSLSCSENPIEQSTDVNLSSMQPYDTEGYEKPKQRIETTKQKTKPDSKCWALSPGTYAEHCRFVKNEEIDKLNHYIINYSEILQAWNMLSKRTQLLKHWHTLKAEHFEKATEILQKLNTPITQSSDGPVYISPNIWSNRKDYRPSDQFKSWTTSCLSNSSSQDEYISMSISESSHKKNRSISKKSNNSNRMTIKSRNQFSKHLYENQVISLLLTSSASISIRDFVQREADSSEKVDVFPKVSLMSKCYLCDESNTEQQGHKLPCENCGSGSGEKRPGSISTCSICRVKCKGLITMCQKCQHGGHLEHILNWFKGRSQCPNINCACQCIDHLSDYMMK